jgi:predicted RNA-binding protein with RPS1 domain
MSEIINNEALDSQNYEEMSSEEFAAAVDATLQNPTDDKVRGLVVSIAPNEVQVEVIGRKQTGYIPIDELSNDPSADPHDLVKVGDELLLLIMRTNDQEGTIMLSKKRVDALKGWQIIVDAEAEGAILDGTVTEIIKGGVLVVTNGVRVFVPASHASVGRMEDLSPLKGQAVQLKILEVNQNRRHAVGSIRLVAQAARKEQEAAFWAQAEVGQEYTGAVKSLTSYGAFVDLGGVDGEIHLLLLHLLGKQVVQGVQDAAQIGGSVLQLHLSALDAAHLQNVIDERQQMLAGALDLRQIVALRIGGRLLQSEVRIAQDRVHGRPDVVGHVEKEPALGKASLHGADPLPLGGFMLDTDQPLDV